MAADRLRGALWGLFAGDAVASPTHWYYCLLYTSDAADE